MENALKILQQMLAEEPNVRFMDGNSMTGEEAWRACLREATRRLEELVSAKPQ